MTATVESFALNSGDSVANNEARMVTGLTTLNPDANDHVFFFLVGGRAYVGKIPV